jgi:hypothetical protein
MGTVVEELVKKLVKKLVDEKCGQKVLNIQLHTEVTLPSYVGKFAKLCRESCHPM